MLRENSYFGVEAGQNENTRLYHSRLPLLPEGFQYQGGLTGVRYLPGGETEVCALLALALDIPGVVQAEVRMYTLTITKSPLFSWDEIEVHILPLWLGIKEAIDSTDIVEIAASRARMARAAEGREDAHELYRKYLEANPEAGLKANLEANLQGEVPNVYSIEPPSTISTIGGNTNGPGGSDRPTPGVPSAPAPREADRP